MYTLWKYLFWSENEPGKAERKKEQESKPRNVSEDIIKMGFIGIFNIVNGVNA